MKTMMTFEGHQQLKGISRQTLKKTKLKVQAMRWMINMTIQPEPNVYVKHKQRKPTRCSCSKAHKSHQKTQ